MVTGRVDGRSVDGPVALRAGEHHLGARDTRVTLEPGDVVPVVSDPAGHADNASWLRPLRLGHRPPALRQPVADPRDLPRHDGAAARAGPLLHQPRRAGRAAHDAGRARAAVVVLPAADGASARSAAGTCPICCSPATPTPPCWPCPNGCSPGTAGVVLGALVTAGAFAAFLSTTSGLTVSVAGVLAQEFVRRPATGASPPGGMRARRIRAFRVSALATLVVAYALSLPSEDLGLAAVVGLAFAVAAATFCPLLVLGVWWPRLTAPGAVAGLVAGGVLATAAVLVTLVRGSGSGWIGALLGQPAAWAVPSGLRRHGRCLARDPKPRARRRRPRHGAPARPGIAGRRAARARPLVALNRPLAATTRPQGDRWPASAERARSRATA